VEDIFRVRPQFGALVARVPSFTTRRGIRFSSRWVVERAAFLLASDEFGDETPLPPEDQDKTMGLRNLKDLLFVREEPAYKAGRQFLIEVQNLGRDIGGIDADLVNSEGAMLDEAIAVRACAKGRNVSNCCARSFAASG
jgi:hypothetical protein